MLALMLPSPTGGLPGGGEGLAAVDWFARGHSLAVVGRCARAIEAYHQGLMRDGGDASIFYNLGICYQKTGQQRPALEAFEQAVFMDPAYAAAWFNVGILNAEEGR
jgi:superkiller protein 3